MKGFFITGTDTGIGKTLVTAALCRLFNESGLRTAPVKPVQTGVLPGQAGDLEIALEAAGLNPSAEEKALLNPYRFRIPASPHLASEIEGVTVDPLLILRCCLKLSESRDCLLVESAGGLMAPLTRSLSTLDLARELGLPLIVVARAALGTLNHTLLTLAAARAAGLTVAAVVLNRPESYEPDDTLSLIENDNRRVLLESGQVCVIGPLPHVNVQGGEVAAALELSRAFGKEEVERLGNYIGS